jgi:Na+-translocating ferredoxin:NAD+ oxidoreductase subunit G
MSNDTQHTATAPVIPAAPESSGLKMVLTMTAIGLFCGILIVLTFQLTLPVIELNKARALEKAIFEVVPAATSKVVFVEAGDGLEVLKGENDIAYKYYAGYDDKGKLVGIALEATGQGFQDIIRILYSYSPACKCVTGMKVMESKETPGLGTKIESDKDFVANFEALAVKLSDDGTSIEHPITLVKHGKKTDPWQIEAITGATISSQAVTNILRKSTAERIPKIERNLETLEGGAR